VITTSEGGTVELIKDEINGFYCKDKDVKNITKKIIYLLINQIKRDQMGNEGKKILENHFDIKFMINNYIRLYKILKD
jgi:N,N'-diacetylbacillosaminyl-diphospho-undecaprenol alpha-1,3-N-acetylgalactosaminyltransferase